MAPPREATPADDRGTRHRAMRAAWHTERHRFAHFSNAVAVAFE